MYKPLMLMATAAFIAAASPIRAGDDAKLVTILTSAEPQTQLMAMVLTLNATKAGAKSHILLCGPAADIALKDAPASATDPQPPKSMSPQRLMKIIMEKTGTSVEVCAIYLPGKGADASILIDGVTPAKPGKMGARIVAPNTKVMSF